MADQEVFGVFKEESGLVVGGEPYEKPVDNLARHNGKQFVTPNCSAITGHGRDSWFDKNLLLATPSDSYIEPLELPTIVAGRAGPGGRLSPEASGPPMHDKPFRPSNPAQRSGKAAGSLYGTFGPISMFFMVPEASSDGSTRPITAPIEQSSLGNIYTKNPKRGDQVNWHDPYARSYRYPDQYRLLAGGSYTYVPDEYQRGRSLEKVLKHEARARIHKPFLGGTRSSGAFTADNELYAKPPPKQPNRGHSASDGRPAWRPNNPPAKGRYCGLLSAPTYIPCPESLVKPQLRASTPSRPFVPSSAGHKRLSMWSVNPYERVPVPVDNTQAAAVR